MLKSGSVKKTANVESVRQTSSQRVLAGSAAVVVMLLTSTAANAACVATGGVAGFGRILGLASSGSTASVISAITTSQTAFQTQSTAFIGSPGDPRPNQEGGGVWGRAIGGQIDTKNTVTLNNVQFQPLVGAPTAVTGSNICNVETQLDFAGFQVGADIGRFNVNGWNLHYGGTAGYVSAKAKDTSSGLRSAFNGSAIGPSLTNNLQIPFAGIYGAATRGGLFIDGQVRFDYYQNELNDPLSPATGAAVSGLGFYDQLVGARGWSVAGNIGYNHALPNRWFIEPSAGFIYSRTTVDPLNYAGTEVFIRTPLGSGDPATLAINDIESLIGRASVRFGTVVQAGNWVLSPFMTLSVFHEFGDAVTARYQGRFSQVFGPSFELAGDITTSTLGTWGQVALGVAGQLPGSGWVWYTRGDYRYGDNIEGWSANAGIRYHYVPEAILAPKMVTKGPAIPVVTAVNWTGFYIGGSAGGLFAEQEVTYPGLTNREDPRLAGVLAGGQIGYNWQAAGSRWVFGVEADGNWTNARGGKSCSAPAASNPFLFTCAGEMDWLAAGTVKVGYAFWDRSYIYLKGGVVAGEVTFQSRCNTGNQVTFIVAPAGCPVTSDTGTAVGWTAGWGGEFALSQNWSARSETRYFSLESVELSHPVFAPSGFARPNVQTDGWISTIGLNYRFRPRRG